MKVASHAITIAVACAVFIGVPFAAFANTEVLGAAIGGTGVDLVSSATMIQDAPSGAFTVFINKDKHANEKVLQDWQTFFSGEEAPLIMEDISCMAVASDAAGVELAESLQSRLPENQMKMSVVDGALALSKAENGLFDVLVMSDEAASAYEADTLEEIPSVVAVHR